MKYIIFLFILAFAACGGSSPLPPNQIGVTCADVYNVDDNSECSGNNIAYFQFIPTANAATLIDAGTINRGIEISATLEVTNNTGADINGWVELKFDAGCGGASEWTIMPKQAITFWDGQIMSFAASGQCGDMQLGLRTLTQMSRIIKNIDDTQPIDNFCLRQLLHFY